MAVHFPTGVFDVLKLSLIPELNSDSLLLFW